MINFLAAASAGCLLLSAGLLYGEIALLNGERSTSLDLTIPVDWRYSCVLPAVVPVIINSFNPER